ncbi:MAG: hypothetical protein SV062_08250 [Thermodesulfobacteriota bacterium]|nr:hypothetical protein [Thermodesulfobacteriota bacterium]
MEKEELGKVECQGCGDITTFDDWHKEHNNGGITHTHSCGYDLSTRMLGNYYGTIQDGSCKECKKV